MFALKIILKNVQRIEITPAYIDSVLVQENGKGKEAMKLENKVAVDIYLKKDASYLEDETLIEKTNICFRSDLTKKTFCSELLNYIKDYLTNICHWLRMCVCMYVCLYVTSNKKKYWAN